MINYRVTKYNLQDFSVEILKYQTLGYRLKAALYSQDGSFNAIFEAGYDSN